MNDAKDDAELAAHRAAAITDLSARLLEAARRGKPDGVMMLATHELYNAGILLDRLAQAEWERDALRADAERGRYMLKHAGWYRSEGRTQLCVTVPAGSDLSCYATRQAAIDAALAGEGR